VITRRQALGAAAVGLATRPAAAFAANPDRPLLEGLVAYQQEVAFGYEVALRRAPLDRNELATIGTFLRDSEDAAATLRSALKAAGGDAPPKPDAGNPPPRADNSKRAYLRDLIAAEEAAVAGYYEALQALEDKRHLRGSAAFMAQSGRRLVALRHLASDPLLPRAFETGRA
jgi:hypothetical protein